jgi:hypothetical protein
MNRSLLMLVCILTILAVGENAHAVSYGSVTRDSMWLPLEELTTDERVNAELHLCLGASAGRPERETALAIEMLWNSGHCDEALTRLLNDQSGIADACLLAGVNWRTPRPKLPGTDWAENQRISDRDSIFRFVFDQDAASGNRLFGFLRKAGDRCYLDVTLSGQETFDGWFPWRPRDCAGVCCGPYFYIGYVTADQNQALAIRFSTATGNFVPFHSGCWFDTLLTVTAPDDSITGISLCSSDSGTNQKAYFFGSTRQRSLLAARTDSFGQPWVPIPTGAIVCDGGVNCAYNVRRASHNPVLVCWYYRPQPDTQFVATGFLDDTLGAFHPDYRRDVSSRPYFHCSPGIAAHRDTVIVTFTRYGFGGASHDTRFLWSGDAGRNWTPESLPGADRSNPDVTGADGTGFAVAQFDGGAVTFTHSNYRAQNWTPGIGVSDYAPDSTERPRVAASDGDDVFYLAGQGSTAGTVWWNNSNWYVSGLADQERPARPPLSLLATTAHRRIVVSFQSLRAQRVRLAVFDAAGRMIHAQNEWRSVGAQSIECTANSFGLVFVRLEVGGRASVVKLAVVD